MSNIYLNIMTLSLRYSSAPLFPELSEIVTIEHAGQDVSEGGVCGDHKVNLV